MSKIKIINKEKLPSTNNAWGFGGSRDKVKYTMSNGDVWVSGTACYRHLSPQKYVQAKIAELNSESVSDFTGGLTADLDLSGGNALGKMREYYKEKGYETGF